MKTIITVIFLVFVIVIGMTEIEKSRAEFYSSLNYTEEINDSNTTSIEEETVIVTLQGEISKPGKYIINKGHFLETAIELAGGITNNADTDCFDYYYEVEEDVTIYIAPVTEDEKISLNTASADELKTLTGIGTSLATRIITYREEHGEFKYLEQIMNVEGIGKSIFNKIKNNICL